MTDREQIAQILKDNITFSPQIGDYVIHGAIERLLEREKRIAIEFASWIVLHGYRPANGEWLAGGWVVMKNSEDFTSDELYEKFKSEREK